MNKMRTAILAMAMSLAGLLLLVDLSAAEIGDQLKAVILKDGNNNEAKIPDFGKKVLFIIYADTQTADDNDPVANALKDKNLDELKYSGLGVANMKDSWVPNFIIRRVIRKKVEQFGRTILADENHILSTAWGLGDCDDKSVVIVIGKDKKLRYLKKGKVKGAEIQKVIAIVEAEIAKH